MPTKFETRMGVMWHDAADALTYGVITCCDDDGISIVPVMPLTPDVHCYDEGLNRRRDCDNVRLESVPPPFSFLCIKHCVGNCYALAAPNASMFVPIGDLGMFTIVDGGEKISELDLDTIFNHPWPEQKELELAHRREDPVSKCGIPTAQKPSAFASLMAAVSQAAADHDVDDSYDGPEF